MKNLKHLEQEDWNPADAPVMMWTLRTVIWLMWCCVCVCGVCGVCVCVQEIRVLLQHCKGVIMKREARVRCQ